MKTMNLFKTLIIIPFICFFSCINDDKVIEPVIANQLNINVDGTEYESINEKIGGNENCDILFINASYYDKNKIDFTIKFDISKEGKLIKVWYEEYKLPLISSQVKKIFLTPNFNPTSTFDVSNFNYDPSTGQVKFNFNGTLYFESDNNAVRNVSGEIEIKSLKSIDCNIAKTGLNYYSNDLNLFSFHNMRIKYINQTQLHRFFSNNGYNIDIYLMGDLWLYPLGEIIFNENDFTNKVEFNKAVGPIIADQIQLISGQQWKNFETSGKIIIGTKYFEKNQKVISGKLNLLIKDNGNIVYKLNGIEFKTSSFED